jgi:hypothetical protein
MLTEFCGRTSGKFKNSVDNIKMYIREIGHGD